jgi:RNA polymerase sigma factor (sigma-70 family)
MEPDDSLDWQRAVAGDGRAFALLFNRHKGRVRRQLHRFLTSPADVDDALAVVFLEAWRRRDAVRLVNGSTLPWLLVTASNTANNLRRGSRRYRALLDRLPTVDEKRDPASTTPDIDVLAALHRLPVPEQQVLTLCVLEGWSERDAATVLAIPPGTVKSRLHRAKRRLAGQLDVLNFPTEEGANRGH